MEAPETKFTLVMPPRRPVGRAPVPVPLNKPEAAPSARTYVVSVLFMKQNERTRGSRWNRAVELFTGHSTIHCELFFSHNHESCSVDSARPVYLQKAKPYTVQEWEGFNLQLTERQLQETYQFCSSQVGKPFDREGRNLFCCAYLCCARSCLQPSRENEGGCCPVVDAAPEHKNWLCSRLVTAALKHSGVLPGYIDEWEMTPASLYQLLEDCRLRTELKKPLDDLPRAWAAQL